MNIEPFRQLLLAKERELQEEISRFRNEARDSRSADVEDPIDQVTSAEGKAAAFQESTLAAETLGQVQAALERIDQGAYGICIDCDRSIDPARLEAVPWTLYCLDDQTKHDEAARKDARPVVI